MAPPAIHPGEILADELLERGVSAAAAARALGIPQSRISDILRGRRGISADTALRLGRWLGTDPELWLNLQMEYELLTAQAAAGEEIERTVIPANASA